MSVAIEGEQVPPAKENRKEAVTMALYVAVCLLAALGAVDDPDHTETLLLVWGTTIGLALAHWFAFNLSSRYVHRGTFHSHEAELLGAEMLGAAAVAALCTVPIILFPDSAELDAVRLLLAGFIGAVAHTVARSSGAGRPRAFIFATIVLVVALAVVGVKNALIGH